MGFLTEGNTMGFEDSKVSNLSEVVVQKTKVAVDARTVVKRDGLKQLVHILKSSHQYQGSHVLLWGDEVEMTCVDIPKCMNQPPKLWMGAFDLVSKLQDLEKRTDAEWKEMTKTQNFNCLGDQQSCLDFFSVGSAWHPEMSRHMIEALPDPPFSFSGNLDGCILGVEESMNARRRKVQALVPDHVVATTITVFPAMGGFEPGRSSGWISPASSSDSISNPGRYEGSPASRSRFIPDDIANPHPRFPTLVENIRKRRGGAYKILIPVYQDVNTKKHPMWNLSLPEQAASNRELVNHAATITPNPIANHIYMDSFAFGMGTSCLQVTVGTPSMDAARHLYDQYVVLAPLVLALTASTPAYRGLLAATDTRWSTLEQACNCRTPEEEDPTSEKHIPKSRYSGVSLYIGNNSATEEFDHIFNDSLAPINQQAYDYLTEEDVPPVLARHFAHLWIRQPLVIYDNAIFIDNEKRSDHFENLNSTNWNSVRFKPPPPNDDSMPFRVELRTAEVQLTDFENAAMASFSAMFARATLDESWELYIPMTKNDENMHASWEMDAVVTKKFWFRTDISAGSTERLIREGKPVCELMSMDEIMSGKRESEWPGLVSLILRYASKHYNKGSLSVDGLKKFSVFCELIKARSSGEVPTCARYLRNIMTSHLHYNKDSVITPSMASRAMTAAALVGAGVFSNDVSSVKPHLGRFVLDVKPLYCIDGKQGQCFLSQLRKNVFEYEGLDGGRAHPTTTPLALSSSLKIYNDEEFNPDQGSSSTAAGSDEIVETVPEDEGCLLEWMIKDSDRTEFTMWNERTCSIHGVDQGVFTPTSECGTWKFGLHQQEWLMMHPCIPNGLQGHHCHTLMKRMLENGADLSKLNRLGFPCGECENGSQMYDCTAESLITVINCNSSPSGPFVRTIHEKERLWRGYQEELQNPDQLPEYKQRRREAVGKIIGGEESP